MAACALIALCACVAHGLLRNDSGHRPSLYSTEPISRPVVLPVSNRLGVVQPRELRPPAEKIAETQMAFSSIRSVGTRASAIPSPQSGVHLRAFPHWGMVAFATLAVAGTIWGLCRVLLSRTRAKLPWAPLALAKPYGTPWTFTMAATTGTGGGEEAPSTALSRRQAFGVGVASLGGLLAAAPCAASPAEDGTVAAARAALLQAIARGEPDAAILQKVDALIPFDLSHGRGATDAALGGPWRLLWTRDEAPAAVQFVRKTLHQPVSTQLLGSSAEAVVGPGRVAQLLDFGPVRFELSSGAAPATDDSAVLVIYPPFRFAALAAGGRLDLVKADSDADFRKVNARSREAQEAPLNRVTQQYLETTGMPGDLRISRITEGDTALVGNVYVHIRMP